MKQNYFALWCSLFNYINTGYLKKQIWIPPILRLHYLKQLNLHWKCHVLNTQQVFYCVGVFFFLVQYLGFLYNFPLLEHIQNLTEEVPEQPELLGAGGRTWWPPEVPANLRDSVGLLHLLNLMDWTVKRKRANVCMLN